LKAVTDLEVLVALKNEKGDFFLRTDALHKKFTLGCNHKHNEGKARHSIEWLYDHSGATEGIKGQPTTIQWAGEYAINDWITWKTRLDLANETSFSFAWIHKIDKNLKIVWSDQINLTNLVYEPKKNVYSFGASFEWRI